MTTDNEEKITDPITIGDIGDLSAEDAMSSLRNAFMGEEEEEEEDLREPEQNGEESDKQEDTEEDPPEVELKTSPVDEDDDVLNLDEDPDTLDEPEIKDEEETSEIDENDKSAVVQQLRKVAAQNKTLVADNDLLNEQLVSKEQEIEKLRGELDKLSATKVDPRTHPDFIEERTKTHNNVAAQLRRVIGTDRTKMIVGTEVEPKWGRILTDVANLSKLPFDEQDAVENNLRLLIARQIGFSGEELDYDMDEDYVRTADEVIKTFGNFVPNYDKLANIHETIVSKSQNKSLELGYKEYLEKTKSIREGMAVIETMSDKDIQEDPESLQAIAATKIRRSPQAKAQFDKIKKAVIEMAYGPEALSQEELDKHAASGKDMVEFHKNRMKRVETFRQQRLTEIASALLIWPEIKEQMPAYFKNKSQSERNESKKQILRKASSGTTTSVKPTKSEEDRSIEEHRSKIAAALGM